MKFQMAKSSLFSVLLRSPWWVSAVIGLALTLLGLALLPDQIRMVGALSGLPFVAIAAVAARLQWHLPNATRVAETHEALSSMCWPAFAGLLEHSYRRDGYTVQCSKTAAVDFEVERKGRRILVCARRWRSARTGLEARRAVQTGRDATDAPDALYIGLGLLTDTARPFAAEHRMLFGASRNWPIRCTGLPLADVTTR